MNNTCICCGEPIPEGRQVCPPCEELLIKNSKSNNSKDMSNKQIEELASNIYSLLRSDTMSRAMASLLYGEGYCKQSDVANDIITDLQRMWRIGRLNDTKHGIDVYVISQRDFHTIINELKKKYTEEQNNQ